MQARNVALLIAAAVLSQLAPAVAASLRVSRENPAAVALWGLLVAAGLIGGSLPLFAGLAVVMPALGHSTWRFYPRAIELNPPDELPIEDRRSPAQDWAFSSPLRDKKLHAFSE